MWDPKSRAACSTHLLWGLLFLLGTGCQRDEPVAEVVVYTALDQEFSEPLFEQFTKQTGIRVRAKFDTEANKTVGLTNLLLNEASRPRCDLFWNNELLNTLRLREHGLLRGYASPQANDYPPEFRAADGSWYGFAARARVLLVNTELLGEAASPRSISDLADPRWKGQCGLAKPLFGTTSTHAACLYAVWGPARAEQFFRQVHQTARILPGNRQVAHSVGGGQLLFGLTDTDDAIIEVEKGHPVRIVYPDQQAGGDGTLFLPNSLALIQNSPNEAEAERLLDFLLAASSEQYLAEGPSAQIPLNRKVSGRLRVETPQTIRALPVDFAEASRQWDAAARFLRDLFAAAP